MPKRSPALRAFRERGSLPTSSWRRISSTTSASATRRSGKRIIVEGWSRSTWLFASHHDQRGRHRGARAGPFLGRFRRSGRRGARLGWHRDPDRRSPPRRGAAGDRKSVVSGKSVSVRVDHGGRRILHKKKKKKKQK